MTSAPVPASRSTAPSLDELEQTLGYRFRDRALIDRALTHSSSANELTGPTPEAGRGDMRPDPVRSDPVRSDRGRADNERLEFLGDSILGWLVSEWLFTRFPGFSEGQLSVLKNHLVSATHLLAAAHRLNLGR